MKRGEDKGKKMKSTRLGEALPDLGLNMTGREKLEAGKTKWPNSISAE